MADKSASQQTTGFEKLEKSELKSIEISQLPKEIPDFKNTFESKDSIIKKWLTDWIVSGIKKGGIDSFLAVIVSYLLEGMQILRFLVPIFGFWMILEQFLFSIPPVLGIVSAISHSLFWGAISLFIILGAVAINPLCKGKEVLWIFVLTSFATLPCNVIFMLYFYKIPHAPTLFHIFVFCVGFLIRYLLVLSMEEIVFCRIGYWIWGK